MPFRVVVSCPDCTGVDPQGCFDGGVYVSDEFETPDEARVKLREVVSDSIWNGKVERLNRDGEWEPVRGAA